MNPNNQHAMNGYRANIVASTSSQNFNDFHPQHSNQPLFNGNNPHFHPSQSMQQHTNTHTGWQQHAMQMNTPQVAGTAAPPIPPQNQAAFNSALWGNQNAIPQSFPPGINPMSNFNIPFLPQQLIQEAYAMSVPVEASDEPTLLSKLLDSRRRSESYKDALNGLHGKNGHSASLWKDYYLDHKERLDSWIAMCLQKEKEKDRQYSVSTASIQRSTPSDMERVKASLPTTKKPSLDSFKREPSPASRVPISAPPVKRPQKSSNHSTPPIAKDQPQPGRRSTINSLTAPSPVYGGRLPAPNAEIKIPDPPSRSPSPPTNVIPHRGRGNKYTKEDRDFFIKFVGWRLRQDPSLTRYDICNLLAEKAPHHSSQSWASHWSNNHDLPDKILAAARGEEYGSVEDSSSEEEKVAVPRRPKYKDPSSSEESESEEEEEEDQEEEQDDGSPVRHYSEKEMGQKGATFTEADIYITAKYIASFPHWEDAGAKERWEPFVKKYPQRSAKSWGEYYRRNEYTFLKLARKIKEERAIPSVASTSAVATQCARPTGTPPKAKRKFEFDLNDETLMKRGRQMSD